MPGPYATVDELAAVLNITVANNNRGPLQACIDAASTEIDHHLAQEGIVEIDPGLLNRTNLNRAVEWWKAPDAGNNGVGYEAVGTVPPTSGFERHAAALLPLKVSWGLA